jgi:hypothetical protein
MTASFALILLAFFFALLAAFRQPVMWPWFHAGWMAVALWLLSLLVPGFR